MKNKNDDFTSSNFNDGGSDSSEILKEEYAKSVKSKKKKKGVKPVIAVVICLVVIIGVAAAGSFTNTYNVKTKSRTSPSNSSGNNIEAVEYFSSYDELKNNIKNMRKKSNTGSSPEMKDDSALIESNAAGLETQSQSNIQVEGVDEADIVKNDGKYIYYISGADYGENKKLCIFSAEEGKTKLVSQISAGSREFFEEMYLNGDKLIAVGNRINGKICDTFVNIYDISDRSNPKLKSQYFQSGSYLTSRLVNGTVYAVSNYYVYDDKIDAVPYIEIQNKKESLSIGSICALKDCKDMSYAIIGAVGLDGTSSKKEAKAVLGGSNNVYCNEKNIYLAGYDYTDKTDLYNTSIVKYSFDGTKIELKAAKKITGEVNDQFSLDEKDGNLRVATTVYDSESGDKDKNYLFVLDGNLNKIGSVSGFANGEHIEAVRYINDFAYVITYEETDPLFVIDLSNPKAPEIKGEVKIDGFSSSLTPVDENTLLGIGYSTHESDGNVIQDGLKFALFNVKNNSPQVLSEKSMKNYDSAAQENHKAICISKSKGYFAVPACSFSGEKSVNKVVILRADNNKLETQELDCKNSNSVNRCVSIGDYVYALYDSGSDISAFKVS